MALVVENGEGLEDAESLVSVAYYLDYCAKRGYDTTATDGKEEEFLRVANEFFYSNYSFKGELFKSTQSMPFPRIINYEYVFPQRIKNAICELVLKLPNGSLLEDTEQRVKREKVGELEVEYDTNDSQSVKYNFVFNLIAPWLNSNGFSSQITRTY